MMGLHREYSRDWRANPVPQQKYDEMFSAMTTLFRAADDSETFSERFSVEGWEDNDARAYEAQRLAKEAQQAWVSEEEWRATMDREEDDRGSE